MDKASALEYIEYAASGNPYVAPVLGAAYSAYKNLTSNPGQYSGRKTVPRKKFKKPGMSRRQVPPTASTYSKRGSKDISQVDPSRSAHDKDDPFRRAPIIGEGAMINSRNQNKKLKLSCGPRIATNNMPVLSQILNQSTRVSVQKGFLYKAEEGVRTFHMQHFRHSAHRSAANVDELWPTTYQTLTTDATDNVMMPKSYSHSSPSFDSPFEHVETSIADATQKVRGSPSQYSPYSIVDLENISWNLQHGKAFYPQIDWYQLKGQLIDGVIQTQDVSTVSKTFAADYPVKQIYGKQFAAKGSMYLNNYYRNRHTRFSTATAIPSMPDYTDGYSDGPGFKGKVVLKGGRVHYQFTNVEAMPAVINIIVYKVRKNLDASANNETNYGWADGTSYPFGNNYLQDEHCKVVCDSYLDKLKGISLKTFEGSPRVASEATTDAKYQFLPKLQPKNGNKSVMLEQQRISFVLAGGETREVDINLPGELYDPTSATVGDVEGKPRDVAAVPVGTTGSGETAEAGAVPESTQGGGLKHFYADDDILKLGARTKQWNNMQYSIAVGVSGADALSRITEGTDAVIEGHITSEANVQCRMHYTEDIGAMHMSVKRVNEQNTRGRISSVVPTGSAFQHAATIIPLEDTMRIAGGPVYETHDDMKTEST